MGKSKVFFTDMRCSNGVNLPEKLRRLILKAGIEGIDFDRKFVAIKIHFGEPGNLSFLRPNYAKVIADAVSAKGGLPFLTDCNTLYVGRRKNALDHLAAAAENGFSVASCGCQIIIADGLKGTDEVSVPLEGTTYVKNAKIGKAVMDADVIISLNHFKGHECAGFGGALKNLGMGCGSRAGKMEMHSDGKPLVSRSRCRGCGVCAKNCAHDAISFDSEKIACINLNKCVGCGRCIGSCNFDAIHSGYNQSNDILNCKIAEYAKAVVNDRPNFHINIVADVSPNCDCHSENDMPIIPNIGIFASFDPVALDMACADACNEAPVMPGSYLSDAIDTHGDCHHDHFTNVAPTTNWRVCLDHAESIGVGQKEYELIKV